MLRKAPLAKHPRAILPVTITISPFIAERSYLLKNKIEQSGIRIISLIKYNFESNVCSYVFLRSVVAEKTVR